MAYIASVRVLRFRVNYAMILDFVSFGKACVFVVFVTQCVTFSFYPLVSTVMTKTAFVRARVKPEIKEQAKAILERYGVSESAFINMSYHAVINEGGIPLSLHAPNAETAAAMQEIRAGQGKRFTGSTDDFMDSLLSDDA